MRGIILHVGADTTNLKVCSPIFEDNTFEFIPIYDEYSGSKKNYFDYPSKHPKYGKTLGDFLPSSIAKKYIVHPDPSFISFTYDQYLSEYPRSQIHNHIVEGDFLFFLCCMSPYDNTIYRDRDRKIIDYQKGKRNKYIFAFFTVSGVAEVVISKKKQTIKVLSGHIDSKLIKKVPSYERDLDKLDYHINDFYLIAGDPRNSALLNHAIRMTKQYDGHNFILTDLGQKLLHRKKDTLRGWRRLDEKGVKELFQTISDANKIPKPHG